MNSPVVVGWLALMVLVCGAVVWVHYLALKHAENLRTRKRTRRNDDQIFKSVEEARNDFS